jgi:aconitate hydratase
VISVDLSAVDPLVMDEDGVVRQVRELAGKPVSQVVLGGDSGASLRDLLAAAALLKSKRVPPKLDFLLAPPSRQALEVLAGSGALVDLIATGARLIEPDTRLITGELYPPLASGSSLRTFDPEPGHSVTPRFVVGSAETLAYAVATGVIGDPRSFKRPVRITVPRTLPTDDVLIVRKSKSKSKEAEGGKSAPLEAAPVHGWKAAGELPIVSERGKPNVPSALILRTLDDVRWLVRRAPELSSTVRAVIAPYIPSGAVPVLSGLGILALRGTPEAIEQLKLQGSLRVPDLREWNGQGTFSTPAGSTSIELVWLAVGMERDWTVTGSSRTSPSPAKTPAR